MAISSAGGAIGSVDTLGKMRPKPKLLVDASAPVGLPGSICRLAFAARKLAAITGSTLGLIALNILPPDGTSVRNSALPPVVLLAQPAISVVRANVSTIRRIYSEIDPFSVCKAFVC